MSQEAREKVSLTVSAPVAARADVLVCGGGPAGVGAAIAAAEQGARTVLVEAAEALGGACTGSLVSGWPPVAGFGGGVFARLRQRVSSLAPGALATRADGWEAVNPAWWQIACLEAVLAAGADVRFAGRGFEVLRNDAGALAGALLAGKGGPRAVRAKVVIDATGDGDIAVAAGCAFDQGDGDGRLQAVSLNFRIAGVEESRVPAAHGVRQAWQEARGAGELNLPAHSPAHCGRHAPVDPPGVRRLQWDTSVGVDGSDDADRSRGLCEGCARVREVATWLREKVPGFENSVLTQVAAQLGVRETRRIRCRDRLSDEDVRTGRKRHDGIARGSFYMDLHDAQPKTPEYKQALSPPPGDWYEVPYGALVPAAATGLLVAGRCVGSTRGANGSLRVQPTCAALGEAAGTAAAMAVEAGCLPHELDGREVRRRLHQRGAEL